MPDISLIATPTLIAAFAAAALIIGLFGSRMAGIAETLADRTGLGEALIGSVLLGAGTSISGIVASVSTAASGAAELSVANAYGGIAAQTMFLAIADMAYRRVNLEHAAASAVNLGQAITLVILVTLPMLATTVPQVVFWGVNPLSPALVLIYLVGLHNAHSIKKQPMWFPRETDATRNENEKDEINPHSTTNLASAFLGLVALVGLCGWFVGQAGIELSSRFNLSQGVVGALLTAVATSLPELVTTIAAVRNRALQLAIGGIIGGNMFDALFIAASDVAFRGGSIYHVITERSLFWMAIVVLMTAILLMGLLRRERQGPAGIGWESVLILGLWLSAAGFQVWLG